MFFGGFRGYRDCFFQGFEGLTRDNGITRVWGFKV